MEQGYRASEVTGERIEDDTARLLSERDVYRSQLKVVAQIVAGG